MNFFAHGCQFLISYIFLSAIALGQSGQSGWNLFEKNGLQGLKENDQVVIEPKFQALGWSNDTVHFSSPFLGYKESGKWGLMQKSGAVITLPIYDALYPLGQGLYGIAITGRFSGRQLHGVISNKGREVISPKYGRISPIKNNFLVSIQKGYDILYGLLDIGGKPIIPAEFITLKSIGENLFLAEKPNGKKAIFDSHGSALTSFEIDAIGPFKNGSAVYTYQGKKGIIQDNGSIKIPARYKSVIDPKACQLLPFPTWEIMLGDFSKLCNIEAEALEGFGTDRIKVRHNDFSYLGDTTLQKIKVTDADYWVNSVGDFGIYRKGKKYGLWHFKKGSIIPGLYDSILLDLPFIKVKDQRVGYKGWYFFDSLGVQKNAAPYEQIGAFDGRYFPVKKRGYFGFINRYGEEVIPCVYQEVWAFEEGHSIVRFHNEYGIIARDGSWVVYPQKGDISTVNENIYLRTYAGTTFLMDMEGEIIYFTENPIDSRDGYLLEHLNDGKKWWISHQGRIIRRAEGNATGNFFEDIYSGSEGFYGVKINGRYGFVDHEGMLRVANRYEGIQPFRQERAAVMIRGLWGFIDYKENLVIQPLYQSVSAFENGVSIAQKDGLFGLIDREGKVLLPLEYEEIRRKDTYCFVRKTSGHGLADLTGRLLLPPRYEAVEIANDDYLIIQRNGLRGVVTHEGVNTIPMSYHELVYDRENDLFYGAKYAPMISLDSCN